MDFIILAHCDNMTLSTLGKVYNRTYNSFLDLREKLGNTIYQVMTIDEFCKGVNASEIETFDHYVAPIKIKKPETI